ncbi:BadF/BadG/BcrA/BcrD ATPase family protein [Monashia sp. NPDC004114]
MRETGVLLAIDAGGSHTRAVVVSADAECLGYGASTSGNATAVGAERALAALAEAASAALASASLGPDDVRGLVLAAAGEEHLLQQRAVAQALGVPGAEFTRASDILAMYHSSAVEPAGVALVAGTGAIAARFQDLVTERIVDGTGWLLGDNGSGFWIGRKVARAVAADLDRAGEPTELTRLVIEELGLGPAEGDRSALLRALVSWSYNGQPVRLARLAPLAFRAEASDATAAAITAEAEEALARTLRLVRDGHDELPVVLGGSVVVKGLLDPGRSSGGALTRELEGADVRTAHDGVAGAAIVGLLRGRAVVDSDTLARLTRSIDQLRGRS